MDNRLYYIIEETVRKALLEKGMLLEMAFSPKEYASQCGVESYIIYFHLGKLFLFGNSTRNAEDWVNQIIDKHLIPIVTAKYTGGIRSKSKMFNNGFVKYYFGENYVDYEEKMTEICKSAVTEVKEGSMRLYNKEIEPIIEIEEAVNIGKNVIIEFVNKAISQLGVMEHENVRSVLKPFLKSLLTTYFGISFDN